MVIGQSSSVHRNGFKVWFASFGDRSVTWMKPFFSYVLNKCLKNSLSATPPVSRYINI